MSKYTTELRWIIDSMANDNSLSIDQRIDKVSNDIFGIYPIWAVSYQPILQRKILKHYYTREIGYEVVGLWKLYLNERMNLIMPYYNQIYLTTVKDYDYLSDTNITENMDYDRKRDETGESNSNATINNSSTDNTLLSDFPQANYAGQDYGTGLSENTGTDTGKSTSDIDSVVNETIADTKLLTKKGAGGARSQTEMLMQYRNSIINIDLQIIRELKDLFMTIY